jgi:hypothetical protein
MASHTPTLMSRKGISKIHTRFFCASLLFILSVHVPTEIEPSVVTSRMSVGWISRAAVSLLRQPTVCRLSSRQEVGLVNDLGQISDRPGIYNRAWETRGNHTDVAGMSREHRCTVLVLQAQSLNDPYKKLPRDNPPSGRGNERRVSVRRCCSATCTCAG